MILQPGSLHAGAVDRLSQSDEQCPGVMDGFCFNLYILDVMYYFILVIIFKPVTATSFDPDTAGKKHVFILLLPGGDGSPASHLVSAHLHQGRGSWLLLFFMLMFPLASSGTTLKEERKFHNSTMQGSLIATGLLRKS